MERLSVINMIRSGSIGGVSGVKGGALAGALGGLLLMLATNFSLGNLSFLIFSMILGLTTGMMAGALLSYFVGFVAGFITEIFNRDRTEIYDQRTVSVWHWYAFFMILWGVMGYVMAPQGPIVGGVIGLILGGISTRVATRDFAKMLAFQSGDDELAEVPTR